MSEKIKFYIIIVLSVLLLICAGIAGGLAVRGNRYKRELGEARLELERVRINALSLAERQRTIDGNLSRARAIVERQQASVSGALGTVSEIRGCIAEIRKYTKELENCLRGNDSSNGANNSNSDGGFGD